MPSARAVSVTDVPPICSRRSFWRRADRRARSASLNASGPERHARRRAHDLAVEQRVEPLGEHAWRGGLDHDAARPGRHRRVGPHVVRLVEHGDDARAARRARDRPHVVGERRGARSARVEQDQDGAGPVRSARPVPLTRRTRVERLERVRVGDHQLRTQRTQHLGERSPEHRTARQQHDADLRVGGGVCGGVDRRLLRTGFIAHGEESLDDCGTDPAYTGARPPPPRAVAPAVPAPGRRPARRSPRALAPARARRTDTGDAARRGARRSAGRAPHGRRHLPTRAGCKYTQMAIHPATGQPPLPCRNSRSVRRKSSG